MKRKKVRLIKNIVTILIFIALFLPYGFTSPEMHKEWDKTYGDSDDEGAFSVIQTSDGGYALAGWGLNLLKTDSSGNMLWSKRYSDVNLIAVQSFLQTSDGGYALAGFIIRYNPPDVDLWLAKTNPFGDIEWDKTYGGSGEDIGSHLIQTSDGGYAIIGYTNSYGNGNHDIWFIKTDSSGNMEWDKTYGGEYDDIGYSLIQTSDGGYAIAGSTSSYGSGMYDIWFIKTDSSGNMEWNETFGGSDWDQASSVIQTSDGGYVIAGYTRSYGGGGEDMWLIKLTPLIPLFEYSPKSPTINDPIYFSDKSHGGAPPYIYHWNFGDGSNSTSKNPIHAYNKTGTFNVTLMVTDEDGMSNSTTKQIIVTNNPPVPDFSYSSNPTTVSAVEFTDKSTDDGTIVSWQWNFGDGTTSNEKNPSHRYNEIGKYTVTLTVTDEDGNTNQISKEVNIKNHPPVPAFTYPNILRTNETIHFTDGSYDPDGYIVSWQWDFGDGNKSNEKNPSHKYLLPGTYRVKLSVKDDYGISKSITKNVNVKQGNRRPVANFTFQPSLPRPNETIMFNASLSYDIDGSVVLYNWDWDNDGEFEIKNTLLKTSTNKWDREGKYNVTLKVEDNNGSFSTITKQIVIVNRPYAKFEISGDLYVGKDIKFIDCSTDDGYITNYTWDFGDGGKSYEINPIHSYKEKGNYTVVLKIKDDDGYEDVFSMKISIVPPPPHHINLFLVISFLTLIVAFTAAGSIILIKRRERRKMMEKEKEEIIDLITRITKRK